MGLRLARFAVFVAAVFFASFVWADDEGSLFEWLEGGKEPDAFGIRKKIGDRGLSFNTRWRGIYFGIVESEGGEGGAFTQELAWGARLDFAKLTGNSALDGLTAFGGVRWRESGAGAFPNDKVQASRLFNPSRYAGGVGWRLLNFGVHYAIPGTGDVKNPFVLTVGWLQPQREFVEQPRSRLFVNNAVASSGGIGGNVPFSSSFSTWGATVRYKPRDWNYTKVGLFMSYPDATDPGNNGLMFQGVPPDNGLFAIGETGVTPKIGSAGLPGRYAVGAYYYGDNDDGRNAALFGAYLLMDQMVFREASPDVGVSDGQGLHLFGVLSAAPADYGRYPIFCQGGLVYEGLIPQRDKDQALFAAAFGKYSEVVQPGRDVTAVFEAGYRVQINGRAFVQPFAQYFARPDGTANVANAAILGLFMGVDF